MVLNENSKIVIFGGLGFIGENLIRFFLRKDFNNIVIIDRDCKEGSQKYNIYKDFYEKCKVINFDLTNDDFSIIKEDFLKAEFMINLSFARDDYSFNPDKIILDYIKENKTHPKLIHFGSRMQYAKGQNILSEESVLEGRNEYSIRKNEVENMYREYAKELNLDVLYLRIGNIYGYSKKFFEKKTIDAFLLKNLVVKGELEITISKDIYKDMIYVDDFLEGIHALLELESSFGQIYNLSSGKKTTIGEMIEVCKKYFPDAKIVYNPKSLDYEDSFIKDVSKIKNHTNWEAKHSFEEGFEKLILKLLKKK